MLKTRHCRGKDSVSIETRSEKRGQKERGGEGRIFVWVTIMNVNVLRSSTRMRLSLACTRRRFPNGCMHSELMGSPWHMIDDKDEIMHYIETHQVVYRHT
jgi:hypothetical protein